MPRVTLRPATLADFTTLIGKAPAERVRAFAAVIDDKLLGVGGLVYSPDGTTWASAFLTPEARLYPCAIWRAGVHLMSLARREGHRAIYAQADKDQPAAERFLIRLGFERREVAGQTVFVWKR